MIPMNRGWFDDLPEYMTDTEKPVGESSAAILRRLAVDGVIGQDAPAPRPRATGRSMPRSRRPVSDIISDQRR